MSKCQLMGGWFVYLSCQGGRLGPVTAVSYPTTSAGGHF